MSSLLYLFSIAVVVIGIQFGTRYYRTRRFARWFKTGMDAYAAQRFAEALAAFRKCVRLAPEWVHARALLGMSLAQTGHREEALREIEMVQALQPKQGETWALVTLFYVLCMPEEHDTLLNALDTLCDIDPSIAATLIEKPQFQQLESIGRYQKIKQHIFEAHVARN